MKVTYAPEDPADGERQEWPFQPRRIRQSQAEEIERAYGKPLDEWTTAILAGDSKARRVLLWHLMRRTHPRLALRDVPDFYVGELHIELSRSELERLLEQLVTMPLDETERKKMADAIQAQLDALDGDDAQDAESGKASTPNGEPPTG